MSDATPDLSLDTSWMADAECRGMTSLFFTERGEDTVAAKAVCMTCTARLDCLEYALVTAEKVGVWGGTSERERRQIAKERRIVRRVAVVQCGTTSGYNRHWRDMTPLCAACREARAAYQRGVKERDKARARERGAA